MPSGSRSPAKPRPPAVARILERVTATVRHHRLIEPGSTVLLGVSGGADSLTLLHALSRLRRLLKVKLAVVHVDHGVHPGSSADARYVLRQAQALGIPATVERVDGRPAKGWSPEAWWRARRYEAFERAMTAHQAKLLATGHTLNDQAETVLLALVRGGGLDALAGMPPGRGQVVRPLLEVTRDETRAFCRALRLRPREDPANADRRFTRSAVRFDVLPVLERATGREVTATIARTADALRVDAAYLEALAGEAWAKVARAEREGLRLDANRLAELPAPISSRVLITAMRWLGTEPTRAHVDALLDLASGRGGRRLNLPGALLARREKAYVRLSLLPHEPPA